MIVQSKNPETLVLHAGPRSDGAGFQPLRTAITSDCGQSFQLIADSIPTIADR
jgi:hypothetical protein